MLVSDTTSQVDHKFQAPYSTDRWNNIVRHYRLCLLCNENDIADEFHYILECNYLKKTGTIVCHITIFKMQILLNICRLCLQNINQD